MTKTDTAERATQGRRAPVVIAALGVAFLAATLWAAQNAIEGSADVLVALLSAALALPAVVSAAALAGGGAGLVAARRPGRLGAAFGAAAGLAVGGAAGAVVLVGYGTDGALLSFAGAVAAVAVITGALAGVRPTGVLGAALAGLLAWLVCSLVAGFASSRLRTLFATDDTVTAQINASGRASLTVALVGGIAAGATAYAYLRRADRGLPWPAYAGAGAGAGLLLVLAEIATRIGGGPLLRLAGSASPADAAALEYVATARLNTALVILFTGAVTAVLLVGRTLKPAR